MEKPTSLDRRSFVKLGTLAAASVMVPAVASADKPSEPTGFSLPALPYSFEALQPHIDAKTMELHHGKHHATYVKNLNEAVAAAKDLRGKTLEELVAGLPAISDEGLRTTIRNNGGGHWNHSFFWKNLAPEKSTGKPSAELAKAIDATFGSMDEMKKAFGAAAAKRFGSGWAWLIKQDGKLKIVSTANQDNPLMKGIVSDADLGTPLIGLDVWEHAYYLSYQNRRPDYVSSWWSVLNWQHASGNFAA